MGRDSGEYCPIARASEVLGERWTPLILRNTFSSALASGRMRIDGQPALARAFSSWGGLSHYAGVRPARSA